MRRLYSILMLAIALVSICLPRVLPAQPFDKETFDIWWGHAEESRRLLLRDLDRRKSEAEAGSSIVLEKDILVSKLIVTDTPQNIAVIAKALQTDEFILKAVDRDDREIVRTSLLPKNPDFDPKLIDEWANDVEKFVVERLYGKITREEAARDDRFIYIDRDRMELAVLDDHSHSKLVQDMMEGRDALPSRKPARITFLDNRKDVAVIVQEVQAKFGSSLTAIEPIDNIDAIFYQSEDSSVIKEVDSYIKTVLDVPPFSIQLEVTPFELRKDSHATRVLGQYLSKGTGIQLADLYNWKYQEQVDNIAAPTLVNPSAAGLVNVGAGELNLTISLESIAGTADYRLYPIVISNPETLAETSLENPIVLMDHSVAIIPLPSTESSKAYAHYVALRIVP